MASRRNKRNGGKLDSRRSERSGRNLRIERFGGLARSLAYEILEDRRLLSGQSIMSPTAVLYRPKGDSVPLQGSVGAPTTAYTPTQIADAYGFNQVTFDGGTIQGNGAGQTIAIIDAYNDPDIVKDLATFDTYYGLQAPPSFTVEGQTGTGLLPATPTPGSTQDWTDEISLDVEWAHALAPDANILLVEANSNSSSDLFAAATTAANTPGVDVVSMSFGGGESSTDLTSDSLFTTPAGHLGGAATVGGTLMAGGVTFIASAGDTGSPAGYPAYSPNVLAVGGTSLTLSGDNYVSETVWNDASGATGGGISQFETEPAYQDSVVPLADNLNGAARAAPDVAFDADPATGVAIVDSFDFYLGDSNGSSGPWVQIGGTSFSAPSWAAIVAIADQGLAINGIGSLNGASQLLPEIYSMSASNFHDITKGNNGTYSASVGYDLVTGRGTPLVQDVVSAVDQAVIGVSFNGLSITSGEASPVVTNGTNFGTVNDNVTDGESFTISDLASGASLSNVTVSVVGDPSFSVSAQPTSPIGPGGSSTFTLQFEPTQPGNFTAEVTVTADDAASFQFEVEGSANNPATSIVSEIDNSSPIGFSTTGTWTTYGAGINGSELYAGAGTGNVQADYTFTGLTPGQYQILASWSPLTAGASNTPFTFYDGGTPIGASIANQSLAPNGSATAGWQVVGLVNITTTTLQVAITNNANPGGSVIADAIEIGQLPGVTLNYGQLAVSDFMTGIAPNATPDTANGTDFGSAAVGFSGTVRTFTLTNNGLATLNFTGSNPITASGSAFSIVSQPGMSSLAPGASTTFQVKFSPTASGYQTGTISIASDGTSTIDPNPFVMYVQGNGTTSTIESSSSASLVGTWTKGTGGSTAAGGTGSSTATYTFTGLTAGQYQVYAAWTAASGNASNAPFTLYNGSTSVGTIAVNETVAPSGPAYSGITYQQLGTVTVTGTSLKVVLSNKANGTVNTNGVVIVPVAATVPPPPAVSVSGNGVAISESAAPLTSNGTNFGSATVTVGSVIETFTINNTGGTSLTLSGTTPISVLGSGFSVYTQPAVDTVAPGASVTFQIKFSPVSTGTVTGTITISSNDPVNPNFTVDVEGTGTPASGVISVSGNGAAILSGATPQTTNDTNFGATTETTGSITETYTITNNGTATLVLTGSTPISVSPSLLNRPWEVVQPTVDSLAVGASTTFQVIYNPTTVGVQTGTVTISSNQYSNGGVFTFNVEGTGQSPTAGGGTATIIDDSGSGFSVGGTWGTTKSGYDGSEHTAPAGTGSDTATYSFTGLTAGTYQVYATWAPTSPVTNDTTDASYAIYNGATLLATVVENQETTPAGGTFNNVAFQYLGTYTITGSLLRVQLTNNANGMVLADAVAIEKAVPGGDLSITNVDSSGGSSVTGAVGTDVAAGTIVYTVTVSNSGPGQALGATVVDNFPASITSDTFTVAATGGATDSTNPVGGAFYSGNINDTVNLPSGSTLTYTIVAQISASASSTMSDTATVTPPSTFIDSNSADNTATDSDTIVQPEVYVGATMTDNVGGSNTAVNSFGTQLTVLHSLTGTSVNGSNGGVSDGNHPEGNLVTDPGDANLMFGITQTGGQYGYGSIFTINVNGTYTTIHSFNNADGAIPWGPVVFEGLTGNFFGTTEFGGLDNDGTIYEMNASGASVAEYDLGGSGNPLVGPQLLYSTGTFSRALLFFTTSTGGEYGSGDVEMWNTQTNPWTAYDLGSLGFDPVTATDNGEYSYTQVQVVDWIPSTNGLDPEGTTPEQGDQFTILGEAYSGGANGFGDIWTSTISLGNLNPSFQTDVTPLYSFTDLDDGGNPYGGLLGDTESSKDGGGGGFGFNFYGTASTGGADSEGTLFNVSVLDTVTGGILNPATLNSFQTLYTFTGGSDGGTPVGDLQYTENGLDLIGVTRTGGQGNGTIYEFNLETDQFGGAYDFPGTGTYGLSGSQPIGGVDVYGPTIYGTTFGGGPNNTNDGEVFALAPPEVVPGNEIDYQFTVTNSGPGDASQTDISDLLGSNSQLSGDTYTAVGSGNASGFTASGKGSINDIVDLPAFSSITYTIVADVSPLAVGSLANTANITVGPGEINENPNSSGGVLTITDSVLISTASETYGGTPGNIGGSTAQIAVSKGSASIAQMGAAVASNGTNVGTVKANSGSVIETYTIKNTGTSTLNLTGPITITGTGFILLTQPSATSLAAGASVTFQVEFIPTKTGEDSATVTIDSNDPTNPVFRFQLLGTAD